MVNALVSTAETIRILVVDDSPPVRLIIASTLRKLGYDVVEAADGDQAYAMLQDQHIRMVVSDWMMPGMDGPALCRKVRESDDLGRYIYFMLVSTRDTNADYIEGMDAGADDFFSKPIDATELRVRMRAGVRVLQLEMRLAERNRRLTLAYEQMREDLDAAGRIQRSLLPDGSLRLEHVECEWCFVPSMLVSGDELNFFQLDERHVGFYNLDVAGHGVQAAMMSVTLSRLLSPTAVGGLLRSGPDAIASPASVARALNGQFQITPEQSMYFTMIYGVLELETGVIRFIQAGHTNPIVGTRSGVRLLTESCPPIGFIPDIDFVNQELVLRPGERLYVYTDGITECEDPTGQAFGEERLCNLLAGNREASLSTTLQSVERELYAWRGSEAEGFRDDISMLAIEYR